MGLSSGVGAPRTPLWVWVWVPPCVGLGVGAGPVPVGLGMPWLTDAGGAHPFYITIDIFYLSPTIYNESGLDDYADNHTLNASPKMACLSDERKDRRSAE